MDILDKRISRIVSASSGIPADDISFSKPIDDMGIDSLSRAEIFMEIECTFQVDLPGSGVTTLAEMKAHVLQELKRTHLMRQNA